MSEPLAFAARLLARRGALVDQGAAGLEAVVPPELASELGLAEHGVFASTPGPGLHHVGYGSSLLERMIASATRAIPFAAGRAIVAPPKPNHARAAAEALVFRNGVFTVGDPVPALGHRVVVHAAFTLHCDDRREGLCAGAASLPDGAIVTGFDEAARATFEEGAVAPMQPEWIVAGARAALSACTAAAVHLALPFRDGVERRFARDRERIESYFADLLSELDHRAARSRVGPIDVRDKRQALEQERAAKLEELCARYATRLEVSTVALVLVEAPVCRIRLELRRRKARREVELEYDAATRALVAPACEACGQPAPRPAACDDAVHLLCEACAPRSEGRIPCGACRRREGRPEPRPVKLAG